MSEKRVRVRVHGRVHGVFFRASVRREAAARGVCGWVRNVPDGTVEAVFEGTERDVGAVVEFCRVGPLGARVDRVELTEEEPEGDLTRFEIRLG
jgi:acylphosphatase